MDGFNMHRNGWLLILASVVSATGCVERRFVIDSNPAGAKAYVNNKEVGFTPVDVPFTYSGTYEIKLEKDGYTTETFRQRIRPRWYAYPPFDFIFENLFPGKISDVRRLGYDLQPARAPEMQSVLDDATRLRERGQNLPQPTEEYQKK
jgi:hypothetical protein